MCYKNIQHVKGSYIINPLSKFFRENDVFACYIIPYTEMMQLLIIRS